MLWWASPCEAIHDKHFSSETQWGLSNFTWGYHHWITLLYLFLWPSPYFKAINWKYWTAKSYVCVLYIHYFLGYLHNTHTQIHRIEMSWFVLVFQAPRGLCRRGLHSVPQIKCFRVCAEWRFHGETGCLQHGKLFNICVCLKLLQTHLCFCTEFVVNVEKKLMLSGRPAFWSFYNEALSVLLLGNVAFQKDFTKELFRYSTLSFVSMTVWQTV